MKIAESADKARERIDRILDEIFVIFEREEVTRWDFKFIAGSIKEIFDMRVPFKTSSQVNEEG
jgi:hypothetical protein